MKVKEELIEIKEEPIEVNTTANNKGSKCNKNIPEVIVISSDEDDDISYESKR